MLPSLLYRFSRFVMDGVEGASCRPLLERPAQIPILFSVAAVQAGHIHHQICGVLVLPGALGGGHLIFLKEIHSLTAVHRMAIRGRQRICDILLTPKPVAAVRSPLYPSKPSGTAPSARATNDCIGSSLWFIRHGSSGVGCSSEGHRSACISSACLSFSGSCFPLSLARRRMPRQAVLLK